MTEPKKSRGRRPRGEKQKEEQKQKQEAERRGGYRAWSEAVMAVKAGSKTLRSRA